MLEMWLAPACDIVWGMMDHVDLNKSGKAVAFGSDPSC